jgi:NADP-dependent 3-hydroxy acid dehydrogenase YdfG
MSVTEATTSLLADRVAVVLGATGWIGRDISRYLLEAGASVVTVARDCARLDELTRYLGATDRGAEAARRSEL